MIKNIVIILMLLTSITFSKTRWSATHLIPDADLYGSGEFSIAVGGLMFQDSGSSVVFRPQIPLKFGISDWFNVEVGYCGGVNLGLKARIYGETGKIMPSVAIGVKNLFSNGEAGLFNTDSSIVYSTTDSGVVDSNSKYIYSGEVYLALGKTIKPIKTRLHFGIQTIPISENDKINFFAGIEKYFGYGLYTTFEVYSRDKSTHLSLFANWRFFKKHLELSLGAVDLKNIFLDEKGEFAVSLRPRPDKGFVTPGIYASLLFHGRFGLGKNKGFMSVEDRMRKQDAAIIKLTDEIDTLKTRINVGENDFSKFSGTVDTFIDSIQNDPAKLSNIILSKLMTLKALYEVEPFDPVKTKLLITEIKSYRKRAIVPLQKILLNKLEDRDIRIYSASLLGDIGSKSTVDVLMDVLATTEDPGVKVEVLIALGKMKETRAMFLMEQLSNSPNDAVAITAQEVLFNLRKSTGVIISPKTIFREVSDTALPLLETPKIVAPKEINKNIKSITPAKIDSSSVDTTIKITDTTEVDTLKSETSSNSEKNIEKKEPAEVTKKDSVDSEKKNKNKKRDKKTKLSKEEKDKAKAAKKAARKAEDAKGW